MYLQICSKEYLSKLYRDMPLFSGVLLKRVAESWVPFLNLSRNYGCHFQNFWRIMCRVRRKNLEEHGITGNTVKFTELLSRLSLHLRNHDPGIF